jgi:uncharacterized protein YkwD
MTQSTTISKARLYRFIGRLRCGRWVLCGFAAIAASFAAAQDGGELVSLINAYRNAPQSCGGKQVGNVGPLAPDPVLGSIEPGSGRPLGAALKESGYLAAQAQEISISGPATPQEAMALLSARYCQSLLSSRFTDIGASRQANSWRIVLARPVLSRNLGDWREAGQTVLRLTNAARAKSASCGSQQFSPAPELRWNAQLAAAALAHSQDMARQNYFRHRASDGSQVGDRATGQGYAWRRIGENIATGQGSAESVMSAWLSSPGHCANLMQAGFTEMGAAFAVNPGSDTTIYWTQVFGTSR